MPLDADALLVGPRGRRLCLAFAEAYSRQGDTDRDGLHHAMFYANHDLDPRGRAVFGPGVDKPETLPEHSAGTIAVLLDAIKLAPADEPHLMEAFDTAVAFARYWQAPDGDDVLAAIPVVRNDLRRVADHIVDSSEALWWESEMDLTGQYEHRFQYDFDHDHPVPERLPAAAELASWRAWVLAHEERAQRDRPADPAASFNGEWWPAPICGLTTSTRLLGDRGPVGLWLIDMPRDPASRQTWRFDRRDDAWHVEPTGRAE